MKIIKAHLPNNILSYTIIIMSSIISLYIFPFLQTNDLFKSEYVVNVDGKKYITHEKGFFNTYILYYDYINVFVSGSQVRMEKDGKGNFDPINNKLDYEFEYK